MDWLALHWIFPSRRPRERKKTNYKLPNGSNISLHCTFSNRILEYDNFACFPSSRAGYQSLCEYSQHRFEQNEMAISVRWIRQTNVRSKALTINLNSTLIFPFWFRESCTSSYLRFSYSSCTLVQCQAVSHIGPCFYLAIASTSFCFVWPRNTKHHRLHFPTHCPSK